jgi:tetratricopeptide (TPR) repeat protein
VRGALRLNITDIDSAIEKNQLLKTEFNTLTGSKLSLPQATDGKLTLLMFIEPPTDPEAELPVEIKGSVTVDAKGNKRESLGVMQHALQLADQNVNKDIKVIAAFLSDDKDRVQALMKKNQWPCQAVMVPSGLENPIVRQLGIVSADRTPNIFLLRPDGTVAWSLSGIIHPQHKSEGVNELVGAVSRGMKANIVTLAMAQSLSLLKQGKFQDAVKHFSGPLQADRRDHDRWFAPQLHGRAVASIGLKDWKSALSDINAAIDSHDRRYNNNKPCSCHLSANLLRTKAMILEKIGENDKAKQLKKQATAATKTHHPSRYGMFHNQLKELESE